MSPASILLVEDNPFTRKMMKVALSAEGYVVTEAPNAATALDSARARLPDLVLQDLLLPDMDGVELARRLHKLPGARDLPILALSGLDSGVFRDGNTEFDSFLQKPIEPSRVIEAIEARLALRRSSEPTHPLGGLPAVDSGSASATQNDHVLDLIDNLLRRVREMCTHPLDMDETLGDLLASYLDACGFGLGAVFTQRAGKGYKLGARFGDVEWTESVGGAFCGHDAWMRELLYNGSPVGWTTTTIPAATPIAEIASCADVRCLLLLPIRFGLDAHGLMVLASRLPQMPPNWCTLAKALQGPLAETLALAQTVANLAVSEQRFRGIAAATADGIIATDDSGRIFYVNPAAEHMFGTSASDLIGASLRHLCPLYETHHIRQLFGLRTNGDQFPLELHTHICEDRFAGAHKIHVLRDLSDRHSLEELSQIANRDPLTHLWNRRRFDEELRQRLGEALRYRNGGALVLLDIDHFKTINDTLGHSSGDAVLKKIAQLLIRLTRGSDLVARLGGDEFALLLPKVDEVGARRCAARILGELRGPEVLGSGAAGLALGCSIGMALFPAHSADPDALFELADQALYQSKREGRRRATMYEPPPTPAPGTVSGIRLHEASNDTPSTRRSMSLADE